jgi:hypothetical protein
MAKYKIFAGLGGSFGGAKYVETIDVETEESAMNYAYESACEEYEGYAGMYGLTSYADIERDPEAYSVDEDADEEILFEAYDEERSSWLSYYVEKMEE